MTDNVRKVHIITYGCQMNEHDSENLAGYLIDYGYQMTDDPEQAFAIIVNSCVVRTTAEERAMGQLNALKKIKNSTGVLIGCAGCMSSLYGKKLLKMIKHLDFVLTPQDIPDAGAILDNAAMKKTALEFSEKSFIPGNRNCTVGFRQWVSIMKGCDNYCSYCIVPYTRGRELSAPVSDILENVSYAVNRGAKEIILLGQNVNSYGLNLKDPCSFPELLKKVADLPGDFRIRFMTSHPKDFIPEIVNIMADNKKLCPHVHLPLQSGSDRILAMMNRHYNLSSYLRIIDHIREKLPVSSITTDIITGFPGETDDDFEKTLDTVKKVQFDGIYTFHYSDRKGTAASEMQDKIPVSVRKSRLSQLMSLQEEITADINLRAVGKTVTVLLEKATGRSGQLMGHDEFSKVVCVPGEISMNGKMYQVRITGSGKWSLQGEILNNDKTEVK